MNELNYEQLKVFIQEDFSTGNINIWVKESLVEGTYNIHYEDGNKLVKTITYAGSINNKMKPFLTLPYGFAMFLFDQITEHTTKAGRKTEKQNFVQGKLEATELHLQGMKQFSETLLYFVTKSK